MGQASGPHTCLGTLLQSVDLESLEFAWVDIQHVREIDFKVFFLDMCTKLLNLPVRGNSQHERDSITPGRKAAM